MRDYDSATGRYVEGDPIGPRGGMNTFAYVGSNPLSRVDPSGLKWCSADFVRHFYVGGGSSVSLGSTGLQNEFQSHSSVSGPINAWKASLASKAEARGTALLSKCVGCEVYTDQFNETTRSSYSVAAGTSPANNCLWSLGRGFLNGSANCFAYVDCASKRVHWSCSLGFQGTDSFTKPLDIAGTPFKYQGQVGGTPYAITIGWGDTISGGR